MRPLLLLCCFVSATHAADARDALRKLCTDPQLGPHATLALRRIERFQRFRPDLR